jgi:hypothetical protein
MKVLQAGERVWFVLDDHATRIHFVIEYGPAVNQLTHETHIKYRVDHWVLRRDQRWPLGYYDELRQAKDACALALGMPTFYTAATAPDGSIVTPEEQRARWQAGLDPRTGKRIEKSAAPAVG